MADTTPHRTTRSDASPVRRGRRALTSVAALGLLLSVTGCSAQQPAEQPQSPAPSSSGHTAAAGGPVSHPAPSLAALGTGWQSTTQAGLPDPVVCQHTPTPRSTLRNNAVFAAPDGRTVTVSVLKSPAATLAAETFRSAIADCAVTSPDGNNLMYTYTTPSQVTGGVDVSVSTETDAGDPLSARGVAMAALGDAWFVMVQVDRPVAVDDPDGTAVTSMADEVLANQMAANTRGGHPKKVDDLATIRAALSAAAAAAPTPSVSSSTGDLPPIVVETVSP